tara:strand:+ start:316 stop:504 length:189 start_codon:yes stop_codon:yes gene_type:complete
MVLSGGACGFYRYSAANPSEYGAFIFFVFVYGSAPGHADFANLSAGGQQRLSDSYWQQPCHF